jgi:hypothetical protein
MSMLEVLEFAMGAGSKTPGTGLVLPCKALAHKPSMAYRLPGADYFMYIFFLRKLESFWSIPDHFGKSKAI